MNHWAMNHWAMNHWAMNHWAMNRRVIYHLPIHCLAWAVRQFVHRWADQKENRPIFHRPNRRRIFPDLDCRSCLQHSDHLIPDRPSLNC